MSLTSHQSSELSSLLAATSPLPLAVTVIGRRPWASALFAGTRLTIAINAADDLGFDAWLATISELDLPLRGHFVASAEVVGRSADAATIELLIVED